MENNLTTDSTDKTDASVKMTPVEAALEYADSYCKHGIAMQLSPAVAGALFEIAPCGRYNAGVFRILAAEVRRLRALVPQRQPLPAAPESEVRS